MISRSKLWLASLTGLAFIAVAAADSVNGHAIRGIGFFAFGMVFVAFVLRKEASA